VIQTRPAQYAKFDPNGHGLSLTPTVRVALIAALVFVVGIALFALWRQFRHRGPRLPRWFLDFTRTDKAMWISVGCLVVTGIILFIANIAMFWSTDLN
jgi:hypothetical protein